MSTTSIIRNVFRPRRRALAAGVVIAFMSPLTAAAGGLQAVGDPARGGTRDVPGGYASWAALFAVQGRMNNEAQHLQAVAGQSGASGFAGAIAAPDDHALAVYWHGGLSREAQAVLARSTVPVTVRPAPYTASEVQAEADRIVARIQRTPGPIVTSVAAPQDGTGVRVTISGTQTDAAGIRRQLGPTRVPLTIITGGQPEQEVTGGQPEQEVTGGPPPSTRLNDPSAGGALMVPVCTLGFTIHRNGQNQMLTARHCFPKGSGSDRSTLTGTKFGTLGSAPVVNGGITVDAAAIKPLNGTKFQGTVWRGVDGSSKAANQFTTRVRTAAIPKVGNFVCTSGARSGEICNIKVTDHFDSYVAKGPDGATRFGPGWQAQQRTSNTPAAGQGDSGGPVYLDDHSSGGVTAVGIISSGTVEKPCQGFKNRFCFRNLTFVGIDDALHALGNAAIVTSSGNKTLPADTQPATPPRPGRPIHDELIDATGLAIGVNAQNHQLVATRDLNASGDEWVFISAGNGLWNIHSASFPGFLEDLHNNSLNWRLVDLGNGWVQIVNTADGDLGCLNTAFLNHQTGRCNAADPAQRFQLVPVESDDHDTATPYPS